MATEKTLINLLYIILSQIISCECSIIVFDSRDYRSGHFAFNSNGDMIVEYSKDNNRLFYGLKSNGKYYFKDDSQNEVPTKEITFIEDIQGSKRYEAKNIFVTIGNKDYLFSISSYITVAELIDLNEGKDITYKIKLHSDFIGHEIFSYVFSLLKMDTNPQQYLISYSCDKKYHLQKFYFTNYGLYTGDFTLTTSEKPYGTDFDNRIVSCFIMSSEIVVFLVGYGHSQYLLYIYDFNLNSLNENNLPVIDSISNFNSGYGIFSKAYYLEDRDAIFIYFTSPNSNALKLKTGTISSDNKSFNQKINKNINEYNFNYNVKLNDFVKVDSKRFIYIGLLENNFNSIYIILFDLYNDYNSMNMRIYQENFDNNHILDNELSADVFNGHLVFTSTCKKDSKEYSILILFGFANYTDNEIDISQYFMDDNDSNENNLIDKLLEGIQIENNIFNYILVTSEIKMISIPDELLLYNKNTGSEIYVSNNDNLNRVYSFKQNQSNIKTDEYYYLDYQPIIEEVNYNSYSDGTIKFVEFNKNGMYQNDYQPKRYYGRTITVKFKLCHRYCGKCTKFGTSDNYQLCLSCLENYTYFDINHFNSNCVPEGYFYDYDENMLTQCTVSNSKFYINLTDNNRICLKLSDPCPKEYPFYNETNKECLNYTLPTTILTTIITTIITTIPKISTTIPTSIITTVPKIPTTIITTIPKIPTTTFKVPSTIPTTITTTVPIKIPTTIPIKIETSMPEFISTVISVTTQNIFSTTLIPTSIQTTIPNLIPTTIISAPPTTNIKVISTNIQTTETIIPFACNYNDLLNDKCSFKNMTNKEIYDLIKKRNYRYISTRW